MSAIPARHDQTTPTAAGRPTPVALITGASAGIGLAVANRLADAGCKLALLARRRGPLDEAAKAISTAHPEIGPVLTIPTDVADPEQAAAAVQQTVDHFGRLDIIVNNAGAVLLKPLEQTTPRDYAESFATNCVGPATIIAAAWPILRQQFEQLAQDSAQSEPGGARIVNVTTMGTHDPFPGFAAYAASKAALGSLARSVKNEGADLGIRAFNVAPGAVETEMLRGLFSTDMVPEAIALTPDQVAQVVAACALGMYDQHNGKTIYLSRADDGELNSRIADA